jgi:2-hydroxychromene-2-carboxylate isomerase
VAGGLAERHAFGVARRDLRAADRPGGGVLLAAFRQAFAAGRELSDVDNVLIAGAACELHPNAVLRGIELRSTKDRLREATRGACGRGVRGVPTVAIGGELFWGDDRLEAAAAAVER